MVPDRLLLTNTLLVFAPGVFQRELLLLLCSEVDTRVVVDGQVITSRGPGTAFEFALTLAKHLCGE